MLISNKGKHGAHQNVDVVNYEHTHSIELLKACAWLHRNVPLGISSRDHRASVRVWARCNDDTSATDLGHHANEKRNFVLGTF